jgi:hypothetical protein
LTNASLADLLNDPQFRLLGNRLLASMTNGSVSGNKTEAGNQIEDNALTTSQNGMTASTNAMNTALLSALLNQPELTASLFNNTIGMNNAAIQPTATVPANTTQTQTIQALTDGMMPSSVVPTNLSATSQSCAPILNDVSMLPTLTPTPYPMLTGFTPVSATGAEAPPTSDMTSVIATGPPSSQADSATVANALMQESPSNALTSMSQSPYQRLAANQSRTDELIAGMDQLDNSLNALLRQLGLDPVTCQPIGGDLPNLDTVMDSSNTPIVTPNTTQQLSGAGTLSTTSGATMDVGQNLNLTDPENDIDISQFLNEYDSDEHRKLLELISGTSPVLRPTTTANTTSTSAQLDSTSVIPNVSVPAKPRDASVADSAH